MKSPAYSDSLVALARRFDRALTACQTGEWHFHYLERDYPEAYGNDPEIDQAPWAKHHLAQLWQSLPGMHQALSALIAQETAPFCQVHLDGEGIVIVPEPIRHLLAGMEEYDYETSWKDGLPVRGNELIERMKELSKGRQIVLWDDEVYYLPLGMPGSFFEIWWRRLWSGPNRHDALYPLILTPNAAYGWDCIGIER